MKIKYQISFLIVIIMSLLSLVSCNLFNSDDKLNNDNNNTNDDITEEVNITLNGLDTVTEENFYNYAINNYWKKDTKPNASMSSSKWFYVGNYNEEEKTGTMRFAVTLKDNEDSLIINFTVNIINCDFENHYKLIKPEYISYKTLTENLEEVLNEEVYLSYYTDALGNNGKVENNKLTILEYDNNYSLDKIENPTSEMLEFNIIFKDSLGLIDKTSILVKAENQVKVSFLDLEDKEIANTIVDYGKEAKYNGTSLPKKEADKYYEYTFSGWDHSLIKVTENLVVRPLFTKETKKLNINFYENSTFLKTVSYPVGKLDNIKENFEKENYKFIGYFLDENFKKPLDENKEYFKDLNLYLKYEPIEYNIKVLALVDNQTIDFGETLMNYENNTISDIIEEYELKIVKEHNNKLYVYNYTFENQTLTLYTMEGKYNIRITINAHNYLMDLEEEIVSHVYNLEYEYDELKTLSDEGVGTSMERPYDWYVFRDYWVSEMEKSLVTTLGYVGYDYFIDEQENFPITTKFERLAYSIFNEMYDHKIPTGRLKEYTYDIYNVKLSSTIIKPIQNADENSSVYFEENKVNYGYGNATLGDVPREYLKEDITPTFKLFDRHYELSLSNGKTYYLYVGETPVEHITLLQEYANKGAKFSDFIDAYLNGFTGLNNENPIIFRTKPVEFDVGYAQDGKTYKDAILEYVDALNYNYKTYFTNDEIKTPYIKSFTLASDTYIKHQISNFKDIFYSKAFNYNVKIDSSPYAGEYSTKFGSGNVYYSDDIMFESVYYHDLKLNDKDGINFSHIYCNIDENDLGYSMNTKSPFDAYYDLDYYVSESPLSSLSSFYSTNLFNDKNFATLNYYADKVLNLGTSSFSDLKYLSTSIRGVTNYTQNVISRNILDWHTTKSDTYVIYFPCTDYPYGLYE